LFFETFRAWSVYKKRGDVCKEEKARACAEWRAEACGWCWLFVCFLWEMLRASVLLAREDHHVQVVQLENIRWGARVLCALTVQQERTGFQMGHQR